MCVCVCVGREPAAVCHTHKSFRSRGLIAIQSFLCQCFGVQLVSLDSVWVYVCIGRQEVTHYDYTVYALSQRWKDYPVSIACSNCIVLTFEFPILLSMVN